MSSNTVAEFAAELNKPTSILLEQLAGAGVSKNSPADPISESDKHKLLSYLQASHGTASAERKKITLTKKSTTEIKQADATGRARTIQVEVRKKRTFIKRDDEPSAPSVDEDTGPVVSAVEEAELARREEEARRQAELLRRPGRRTGAEATRARRTRSTCCRSRASTLGCRGAGTCRSRSPRQGRSCRSACEAG